MKPTDNTGFIAGMSDMWLMVNNHRGQDQDRGSVGVRSGCSSPDSSTYANSTAFSLSPEVPGDPQKQLQPPEGGRRTCRTRCGGCCYAPLVCANRRRRRKLPEAIRHHNRRSRTVNSLCRVLVVTTIGSCLILAATAVVFCGDNLGWWTLRRPRFRRRKYTIAELIERGDITTSSFRFEKRP